MIHTGTEPQTTQSPMYLCFPKLRGLSLKMTVALTSSVWPVSGTHREKFTRTAYLRGPPIGRPIVISFSTLVLAEVETVAIRRINPTTDSHLSRLGFFPQLGCL